MSNVFDSINYFEFIAGMKDKIEKPWFIQISVLEPQL